MDESSDDGISNWLARHGFGDYAPVFAQHAVDLETLSELTYEHLREMGLPLGVCLRLRKALADHVTEPSQYRPAEQEITKALAQVATERRQVTAMFCDIVGSTKMAADLDPEEMRGLLLDYWTVVETTTARYQGYIAQHLGDGALIYFGFPEARENDAERAILAGLELLAAISNNPKAGAAQVQLRIGLATGTVVINQFKGAAGKVETLAIGQSVNFASRLQSLAVPGSLMTDAQTRALVGGLFTFEDIGLVAVDGFSAPVPLFKVTGAKRVRSRFEAQQGRARTVLRGRKAFLEVANDCWQDAIKAQGQLLLVTGEPGIGKSRFVQELLVSVGHDAASCIQLQGAAHSSSSPLFPVIESLSIMANVSASDSQWQSMERLRSLLAMRSQSDDILLGLFAQGTTQVTDNPQQLRNKTLDALVEFFAAKCADGPLLMVVEDLHLCDPTTLEFLDRFLLRARTLPILVLGTARPEFTHVFSVAERVTTLALMRLGRDDTDDLVREFFGNRPVTSQLLDIVAERTDGVPLFVEELLKSLVEGGAVSQANGETRLNDEIDGSAIPRSLQSILTARLDKLRGAKRVAQIAACIGRTFSTDLLRKVTPLSESDLQAQLDAVAASDLIVRTGQTAEDEFSFRHALVRDAAYGSLLFSEREAIHGQIADALAASLTPVRPEVLAHHLTRAQRHMPAVVQWAKAGETAMLRSADAEAVQHLKRALGLVEQLPAGVERDEQEFSVLLALIAPLRAARGFAAPDVAALTTRAIELADKVKDVRRILPLLYNRWVYRFVTSHRDVCEPLARDILDRSTLDGTNLLQMTGLRALAATQFTAGQFQPAAQNFDASIDIYKSVQQAEVIHALGLDAKVTALGYCALTRWCLGERDRAYSHISDALATAAVVDHISTTIFAIYHEALLDGVLEQNASRLRKNGRSLQGIGQQHGFSMWLICGKLLESLGEALEDPSDRTLGAAESNLVDFADMGVVYRPTYHALLAEICLRRGDVARGIGHVRAAKDLMVLSGERWNEAELFRLEGALASDLLQARQCFGRAREISALQGAVVWRARADAAIARLNAPA